VSVSDKLTNAEDCQSVKAKYEVSYQAQVNFKVGLITTNFYEEITNPQQVGRLRFFDLVYITKAGEWGERVRNSLSGTSHHFYLGVPLRYAQGRAASGFASLPCSTSFRTALRDDAIKLPKNIRNKDLAEAFCHYVEDDYYDWMKDNFNIFFQQDGLGRVNWAWIRHIISKSTPA